MYRHVGRPRRTPLGYRRVLNCGRLGNEIQVVELQQPHRKVAALLVILAILSTVTPTSTPAPPLPFLFLCPPPVFPLLVTVVTIGEQHTRSEADGSGSCSGEHEFLLIFLVLVGSRLTARMCVRVDGVSIRGSPERRAGSARDTERLRRNPRMLTLETDDP